jgi:hypothetical protein
MLVALDDRFRIEEQKSAVAVAIAAGVKGFGCRPVVT